MTLNGWTQIGLFTLAVLLLTAPMGTYLAWVFEGRATTLAFIERAIYRLAGVNPSEEQHWTTYLRSVLLFSAASMLLTYAVLRWQQWLPLNPQRLPGLPDRQAFETAASFTTNTNWQSYSGESTMSYFSQLTQLAYHNFVSAAAGMGIAVALIRGIARRGGDAKGRIGNFWTDLVRGTIYVLVPLSALLALLFVQQGAIQTLAPYAHITTLEGSTQTIALGPVASQEAIKQLGTNGGGFFNANSAHPFENPTPWTNFWQMVAIFVLPAGLVHLLGTMTGHRRHAWSVLTAMFLLFLGGVSLTYWAEASGNPIHAAKGVAVEASVTAPGGNMEGKEVRFGIASSALYSVVTTDASSGAVNSMHDSFTPLAGMVPIINMQLGEVIFGGVGAGLYGMIIFVVLTVFIAGLMVGRTPEYLGKKIQAREVQMTMLYVLAAAASILVLTAVSVVTSRGLAGLNNAGPHGFSEILYAFSSTTANNGSAFAGLSGGTYWYNTLFGVATLVGRFALIVPVLALAGFFAEQRIVPASSGSFPVSGLLFTTLLIGVIGIVGALTFFPALALGPIAEQMLMRSGVLF